MYLIKYEILVMGRVLDVKNICMSDRMGDCALDVKNICMTDSIIVISHAPVFVL